MNSSKRKSILFVSARLPYPTVEGHQIRTFGVLQELAKQYDIYLLSILRPGEIIDHENSLGKICKEIHGVPITSNIFAYAYAFTHAITKRLPFVVSKYVTPSLITKYKELVSYINPDLAHFDLLPLGQLARYTPSSVPFVLNEHNVESSLIEQKLATLTSPLQTLIFNRELKYLRIFESSITELADLTLACSHADKIELETMRANKVQVIPNGIDTNFLQKNNNALKAGYNLVFLGGMGWYPNRFGLIWFIENVFPLLISKLPDIHLNVIGNPEPSINIPNEVKEHINILGFVDDFRSTVSESSIMIVPLNLGSGTRLKVLEGMAMGKCIVSTSKGSEGIEVTHGEHLLLANTAEEFCSAIIDCFKSPDLLKKLGSNAQVRAVEMYDWNVIGKDLIKSYDDVMR